MSETPIVLFVSFLAQPGQEGALSRRLLALSRASLTEPGCLRYDVHQDLDDSGRIWLYEYWGSQAALTAHDQTDHVAEFVADLPTLAMLPFDRWRAVPTPPT